ncbi:MAG: EamA family transporter [Clostridia bacterium]|nr:EamA family transporter [Clostridia bacterium]
MGYLFLAIALAAGVTKGYCGKKTSYAIVTNSDSMITNVLRMVACIIIGFLLTVFQKETALLAPNSLLLLIAALSGVASAAFVVSWLLSVRSGAYMMVEVFLLIGVIVPILLCRVFFAEEIGLWQVVGIAVLLVAVYIMCTYNTSVKGKMSIGALCLLILCGLSNGVADFSQKLFVKLIPDGSVAAFNFYTYVFAAVTLLVAYVVFYQADKKRGLHPRKPFAVVKPIWYYVLIMAVCLFANSFFKTQAALYLDAVQIYPLNQGCSVILSLLMAAIIFKEKINIKCIVGICLSFVALLMINLL